MDVSYNRAMISRKNAPQPPAMARRAPSTSRMLLAVLASAWLCGCTYANHRLNAANVALEGRLLNRTLADTGAAFIPGTLDASGAVGRPATPRGPPQPPVGPAPDD